MFEDAEAGICLSAWLADLLRFLRQFRDHRVIAIVVAATNYPHASHSCDHDLAAVDGPVVGHRVARTDAIGRDCCVHHYRQGFAPDANVTRGRSRGVRRW